MADEQQNSSTYFEINGPAALERYIPKGQVVEIEVKLGLFAGQYKSKVTNYKDKTISFVVPSVAGKPVYIWEKTVCHMNYMRPDGMFTFITRVVKSEIYPKPILYVIMPEKVEKIQRRRYVRVDVKIPVRMRLFKEDATYEEQDEQFFESTTINVSAGGLRVDSPKMKLELGKVYEFEFVLENYKFQHVLGEIVRAAEMKNAQGVLITYPDGSAIYNYGVNFIQIHRVQKEKIISYVFKCEREMISKR